MYNGIGLSTARGSGTNGYVSKNLAQLKASSLLRKASLYTDLPTTNILKSTSEEMLLHNKKRKVELAVLEYQDTLEAQHLSEEELAQRLAAYRARVIQEMAREEEKQERLLSQKDQETEKLRIAFGIKEGAQEGDAFKFEEHARRRALERSEKEHQGDERALEEKIQVQPSIGHVSTTTDVLGRDRGTRLTDKEEGEMQEATRSSRRRDSLSPRERPLSTDLDDNRRSRHGHHHERDRRRSKSPMRDGRDSRHSSREKSHYRHERSSRRRSRSPPRHRH